MSAEELMGINKKEQLRSTIDSIGLEAMMDRDFTSIKPQETLSDVIKKMRDLDLHEIPVISDDKGFMGIVSYGQLLKRKNISITTKAESLLVAPRQITSQTPVTELAESFLSTGYRQMPVMDGSDVRGIVSRTNMIKIIQDIRELRNIPVREVMSPDIQTVKGEDRVETAVTIMKNLDIRTLPVVDGMDRVTGMVGVKDISNYNWRERNRQTVGELTGESSPVEVTVSSVMVEPAVTINPMTSLGEAAKIMVDRNISTLPVIEKGTLVGIITKYDIIELIASFRQRNMVYVQITGLGQEERYSMDVMEKEIQASLAKIAKIQMPLLFNMHVAKYSTEGNTAKYAINGRLITTDKIYMASAVDWNIMKATISLMQILERRVIERKEVRIRHKKTTRNIGHV